MSIISPLPYTIVNGSVIDADPVMADFNQIVNNVNSNAAAINGSTAQVFNVATAVTADEAVPYGQAQSQFAATQGSPSFQFAVANATYPQSAVPLGQAQADFAAINGSATQVFNVETASLADQAVPLAQALGQFAALSGNAGQVFNVAPAATGTEAVPLAQAQADFAAINGSAAQVFNVATAVTADEAVPYGQAQSEFAATQGSPSFQFAVANATYPQSAVALGQLTAPSPNLLVNGSAEFGSLAWSLPTQAGYTTGTFGEGTYFTIGSAVNGTYVAISADYAVVPGVALTLQAEIFASGLTAGALVMDLEFLDASHTIIATGQANTLVTADQNWTFMSASATTPANTAYWHARFYMQAATLTTGAIRKIKVSGGTAASPYSREADFPLLNSGPRTVAGLPAGITGQRAFATDANAPTFLNAVAGGGAVVCPVFFNGSAWIVG